ncbi:hypothetical protein SLS56_011861 [Neofusicoccum ribis]|uniref:Uncharacterized protein n=1 Tax=Neofusicoccum ribis TaxID=45134 RepID=A0ABR3SAE9_9PEZI
MKSVVFRVRGISIDGRNNTELKSALSTAINSRLVENERLEIEFSVDIVASCYSPDKMVGLVDFRGGVPSFLSSALKDPQKELQMVIGESDITFDCNFFDFTQLYNVKQPINADRVMTYGYNSKLTGGSRGLERILDYGRNFIEDIKQIRSTDKETRRPLMFIAHSFGGIILAHSMIKAVLSRDKRSEMIYAATYGILFFGTPHKGLLVDDIRRLVAGNDHPRYGLLDQIQLKSDSLSNQLADFRNIFEDRKIVSFYETEQTRQLAFNSETVRWERTGEFITAVDIDSALLQLPDTVEKKLPVRANHSTIVKFDSKEDGGYRTAITLLQKFEDDAPQTVEARFAQHQVLRRFNTGDFGQTQESLTDNASTKSTPPTGSEFGTHVTSEFQEPKQGSTEMTFTQSNVECLSMRAYELFVRLKDMSDDVHLTLKKLNVPLFSFKCALDHLSRRVNILLTRKSVKEAGRHSRRIRHNDQQLAECNRKKRAFKCPGRREYCLNPTR